MSLKVISATGFHMLQEELKNIEIFLEDVSIELQKGADQGDKRENEEYEIALREIDKRTKRKQEIEHILHNAKIKEGYSTNIDVGTLISVKILGDDPEDLGLLMFDNVGDLVLQGRITPASPLGRAIIGSAGGIFKIQDMSGDFVIYEVKVEPETRLVEYLGLYPIYEDVMFNNIFSDE